MSRVRGRPLAVGAPAVLAGCLLLAACTGTGSGAPVSSRTVTPSVATSSPTPTTSTVAAPTLPPAATAGTRAGAEAFFRHFWDVYNYSYASLDARRLRAISDKTCKFCSQAADGVELQSERGGRFEGGTVVIRTVVVGPGDPKVGLVANAVIDQQASKVLDSTGAVQKEVPADSGVRVDAALAWDGSRWHLLGIDSGKKASS